MRQQLISWLIEDIAPEVRQTRDAPGTILKFAQEKNLAPALVQGLGQLYNTAKTLAFLEKSSREERGNTFPILDVDKLVQKYLEVVPVKEAGMAEGTIDTWEFDNPEGVTDGLPACFNGLLTPVLPEEIVINETPDRRVKQAFAKRDVSAMELQLAEQIDFDAREEMNKLANEIAQALRENLTYPFEQFEADALGLYEGDEHMKGTVDKVAEFCANCHPRVKISSRAKAPTARKLLNHFETGLMQKLAAIDQCFYRRKACSEFLQTAKEATVMDLPRVEETRRKEVVIPSVPPEELLEAASTSPRPKSEPTSQPSGDADVGFARPRREGKEGPAGSTMLFDQINRELDKVLGATGRGGGQVLMGLTGGRNRDQELIDNSMRDARHIAVLQNLLTTDEILSEADPDRVVQIYNTIRETAPDVAADVNVMRVLLRSAIQHDGIAPFDLKNILETELAKQKVDWNRRLVGDVEYAGAKSPVPNRPM